MNVRASLVGSCMLLASVTVAGSLSSRQAVSAEALMGQAQHLQDFEGDYPAAIAVYKKVLAVPGVGRETAARARLAIAICHERLGSPEARGAYEAVIASYADQQEVAAEARRRLSSLVAEPPRAVVATLARVPLTLQAEMVGPPSPDGRYLALRQARSGDAFVQDLKTGKVRQLTKARPGTLEMNDTGLLFSPDGRSVAYVWRTGDLSRLFFELHIYDLQSGSDRVVLTAERLYVLCWASDGASIVFTDYQAEAISRVSLGDGAVEPIMPMEGMELIGYFAMSPDGQYLAYDFRPPGTTDSVVVVRAVEAGTQATVARGADSKAVWGWSPDGRHLYFTTDQSGTVDLVRVPIVKGRPAGDGTPVHRDLGKATPLGVTRDGTLFFSRSRNLSDVFVAGVDLEAGKVLSPPARVDASNSGRTTFPAWSPDGKQLGYLCGSLPLDDDGPAWVNSLCIKSIDSGNTRTVRTESTIGVGLGFSWCCQATGDYEIRARGHYQDKRIRAWRLDPVSGRVLGEAAASPSIVRYAFDKKSGFAPIVVREADGKETEIYRGRQGERARMLDISQDRQWFAVVMSPNEFDAKTARVVVAARDGSGHRELAQMESPFLPLTGTFAPDNRHLVAVVTTGDLDVDEAWVFPVDGSPRRKLDLGRGKIRNLAFRPDGRQLAFVNFQSARPEVWTLENIGAGPAGRGKARRLAERRRQ